MIKNYKLSAKAGRDVYNIMDYTAENFGLKQAGVYYDSLQKTFDLLIKNPKIGRLAENLGEQLHRYIHQKHIIFYTIRENDIFILRIIHHKEDSENYNL